MLDYRWNVARSHDIAVVGVLATNEPVSDDESAFCKAVGITTTSPQDFARQLAPLLVAP